MKVLAINASPNREGSTAKLIDMLLAACEAEGVQCEKVNLEDYMIEGCVGCSKCIKGSECSIDDDYLHLKAKMIEADGIIIGSPYYNGTPVERLQIFMSRLSVSANQYQLFDKKYILGVATSAVNDCRNIAEYCATLGNSELNNGSIVSGLLYECMVTNDGVKDISDETAVKQKVNEVAIKFVNDLNNKNIPFFLRVKRLSIVRQAKNFLNRLFKKNEAA